MARRMRTKVREKPYPHEGAANLLLPYPALGKHRFMMQISLKGKPVQRYSRIAPYSWVCGIAPPSNNTIRLHCVWDVGWERVDHGPLGLPPGNGSIHRGNRRPGVRSALPLAYFAYFAENSLGDVTISSLAE